MSVHVADELIQAVASALATTADRAAATRDASHTAVTIAVAGVEQERTARRTQLARAEAEASAAGAVLRACLGAPPPCDCTGPARRNVEAQHRLAEAQRRLQAAEGAVRDAQRMQAEHFGAMRILTQELEAAQAGATYVRGLLSPLSQYRQVGVPTAPGGKGVSAASVQVSSPVLAGGLEVVDLAQIDDSDSAVSGPGSFTKMSYADARWATETLDDRVMPAVRAGKDRDYFVERDAAEGRGPDRSLARLFDTYFGSTAITLSARSDGRLEVVGGYHRIWAARQAGVTHLPARIRR
jgi:hypothetical protein